MALKVVTIMISSFLPTKTLGTLFLIVFSRFVHEWQRTLGHTQLQVFLVYWSSHTVIFSRQKWIQSLYLFRDTFYKQIRKRWLRRSHFISHHRTCVRAQLNIHTYSSLDNTLKEKKNLSTITFVLLKTLHWTLNFSSWLAFYSYGSSTHNTVEYTVFFL